MAAEPSRKDAIALLARANGAELRDAWAGWDDRPAFQVLRKPEIGLAMVRGRIGGGGGPFNLGEATITRATVRVASGEIGFSHILGRDRQKALHAAIFDALWQTAERERVEAVVLGPVRARLAAAADLTRRQVAATRVNFFTLVRGED